MVLSRIYVLAIILAIVVALPTWAQVDSNSANSSPTQKIVVVTGNRFSYKLVQKWIDDYNKIVPDVQIVIESRGSADPTKYDVLAEVYQPNDEIKKNREYLNVGRYAVLPVATSSSAFAKHFSEKGLTKELLKQIYFNDIFAEKDQRQNIDVPYTVYTRQQKAGVPFVFAKYFDFQQKDLQGTTIAGADEHLLKATLRDPNGVTYLPLALIYDQQTRKPVEGLTVIPVDLNGNGKINDEEKFYGDLNVVIETLEKKDLSDIKNVPIEYLHLSVDKQIVNQEAINFLKWVNEHGQSYLHEFGYLLPEAKHFEKEKFIEFASKRSR
ncbi:substrate-binding domain-containing protein [Pseudochryseolinea flava]|uniref:PBP domain-containing protein n=1 Tax=Pseudochryseolinea flava TaxID=2059302 RepID=A0A364Y2I0_9BACT|nr:hypothetical protein [Pseudochryseolinea flava]RAW01075.1 hypothetical protein DQQ10_12665 [Pseudochryseolinea flava]